MVDPLEPYLILLKMRLMIGISVFGEIEPATRERILVSGLDPVNDLLRILQIDIRDSIERELER